MKFFTDIMHSFHVHEASVTRKKRSTFYLREVDGIHDGL